MFLSVIIGLEVPYVGSMASPIRGRRHPVGAFEAAAEMGGGAEAAELGDALHRQGSLAQVVRHHLQPDLHQERLEGLPRGALDDLADILLSLTFFFSPIESCGIITSTNWCL